MRPDRVQIEPAGVTAGKAFSGSNALLKKFVREYMATSATISSLSALSDSAKLQGKEKAGAFKAPASRQGGCRNSLPGEAAAATDTGGSLVLLIVDQPRNSRVLNTC